MAISGGCLCGAIRYRIEAAFARVNHCYCGMCRRQHGAAFATFGTALRSAFTLEDPGQALRDYRSSAKARRSFCGRCGSSLFWQGDHLPDTIEVALGTLDGEPGRLPEEHIFVQDKPAWVRIGDDLPQYPASSPNQP